LETALLEDIVHTLLLVGRDGELLNDVRVLPPDTGRSDAELGVHVIHCDEALVVHLVRLAGIARGTVGRGWGSGSIGLLCQGEGAQEERSEGDGEDGGACHVSSFGMRWTGL